MATTDPEWIDPEDCDHEADAIDLSYGETDVQADSVYVSGVCNNCGAELVAVHPRTHYLVFDGDDDPTEVEA